MLNKCETLKEAMQSARMVELVAKTLRSAQKGLSTPGFKPQRRQTSRVFSQVRKVTRDFVFDGGVPSNGSGDTVLSES